VHTHTHTHTHTHIYITKVDTVDGGAERTPKCVCQNFVTYIYIYTHIHTYIYTYIHTYMYKCVKPINRLSLIT